MDHYKMLGLLHSRNVNTRKVLALKFHPNKHANSPKVILIRPEVNTDTLNLLTDGRMVAYNNIVSTTTSSSPAVTTSSRNNLVGYGYKYYAKNCGYGCGGDYIHRGQIDLRPEMKKLPGSLKRKIEMKKVYLFGSVRRNRGAIVGTVATAGILIDAMCLDRVASVRVANGGYALPNKENYQKNLAEPKQQGPVRPLEEILYDLVGGHKKGQFYVLGRSADIFYEKSPRSFQSKGTDLLTPSIITQLEQRLESAERIADQSLEQLQRVEKESLERRQVAEMVEKESLERLQTAEKESLERLQMAEKVEKESLERLQVAEKAANESRLLYEETRRKLEDFSILMHYRCGSSFTPNQPRDPSNPSSGSAGTGSAPEIRL